MKNITLRMKKKGIKKNVLKIQRKLVFEMEALSVIRG